MMNPKGTPLYSARALCIWGTYSAPSPSLLSISARPVSPGFAPSEGRSTSEKELAPNSRTKIDVESQRGCPQKEFLQQWACFPGSFFVCRGCLRPYGQIPENLSMSKKMMLPFKNGAEGHRGFLSGAIGRECTRPGVGNEGTPLKDPRLDQFSILHQVNHTLTRGALFFCAL